MILPRKGLSARDWKGPSGMKIGLVAVATQVIRKCSTGGHFGGERLLKLKNVAPYYCVMHKLWWQQVVRLLQLHPLITRLSTSNNNMLHRVS